MNRTALIKHVTAAVLVCGVLVTVCMIFIDRPLERLVSAHQTFRLLFQFMATPSLLTVPLACVYMVVSLAGIIAGRPVGNLLWLQLSLATIVADAVKDELKWMLGRPWPEYWIKYGIYTFHPFDTSYLYGSFPSGHTTYIAAPMLVLWWMVPRYRIVWAGLVIMVMVGLVGAGYHFIGDVIAGFFVGLAAAAGTLVWLEPSFLARNGR